MTTPKVFVGTMYCGEGDYYRSCQSIVEQRGVDVQHMTIVNLPEKEAHNNLWEAWRTIKHNGFDMFIKVDADTVLAHEEVLLEFWKLMNSNPRITGIQAPLHDYFTDGFINGLNCFSPRVTFRDTADELFCDRQVDVDHDIVIKAGGVTERLRPAGHHCFFSTEIQAFHYGLHRQLKGQYDIINKVKAACNSNNDRRRFVLLGATMAPKFACGKFNYTDSELLGAFEEARFKQDELLK
jgi:hypothetical protein